MTAPPDATASRPVAGGAAMVAASQVVIATAGAAATIAIARLLGPADVASYALALTLALALSVVATLGVELGLTYYVIIRETNTGVAVAPDDVDAIAAALRGVASGELGAAYRPQRVEQYIYPRPAEAMAEAIEAAVMRRAAQR